MSFSAEPRPEKDQLKSVRRDREVDRDLGLSFNCLAALKVWFEVPLPDCVLGRGRQNVRPAYDPEILNDSILADQGLQDHRALHFHLSCEERIVGLDWDGDKGRGI